MQNHNQRNIIVIWIQEGFTAEPPETWFGGRILSQMIRIQAQNSELQAESRSYGQKSEIQPGRPPESEPNRPEMGPEWGLGASAENPPLKPSWIQLNNSYVLGGFKKALRGILFFVEAPKPHSGPFLGRFAFGFRGSARL